MEKFIAIIVCEIEKYVKAEISDVSELISMG